MFSEYQPAKDKSIFSGVSGRMFVSQQTNDKQKYNWKALVLPDRGSLKYNNQVLYHGLYIPNVYKCVIL